MRADGRLNRARLDFRRLSRPHAREYRARLEGVRECCARCPRDAAPFDATRTGAQKTNGGSAGRESDYSFGGNLGELPVFMYYLHSVSNETLHNW